jgi:lipopolysaccharide transport system permease protein
MHEKKKLRARIELWSRIVAYEVRKSHVGSALGICWAVVEPLLLLSTYSFIFIVVLDTRPGGRTGAEHALFIFSGLVPWLYFAGCLSRGLSVLNSHAPLVKQINFPIGLLPFVTIAQVTVELVISLLLLVLLGWIVGAASPANLLLIPAVVIFALFLVGLASITSCYAVMLPDLQKLIPTVVRIGIFITPVFWSPVNAQSAAVKFVAYANPISYFIAPFRYAVRQDPSDLLLGLGPDLAVACAITLTMLLLAYLNRGYVRRTVVDYL